MSDSLQQILDRCNHPFEWGKNDCCTLLGSAIQGESGWDILRGFRGYKTKLGAAKKLREKGKGTLVSTLDDLLGSPIPVAKARPKDIVMMDSWRVGVCCGRYSAFIGDAGIEFHRTLNCQRAYRNQPRRDSNG